MPKRTVAPRLSWQRAFAQEWIALAEGNADVEVALETADDLFLKNQHRDPRKVAAQDFARAIAPKRDLIPGFNAP